MTAFTGLLQAVQVLTMLSVPEGSQLRVRMETPVASWSSLVDTPIHAVMIAPLLVKGQTVLPAGCTLWGRVQSVTRVGLGIRHERASLGLEFSSIMLPSGETGAIETRLAEVDNGRERVGSNGLVRGVRATNSIAYRVSGYIQMALMWQFHTEVAGWVIKSLAAHLAEPEIDYPVGTELTLSVTAPWVSKTAEKPPERLSQPDSDALKGLVALMPFRTTDSVSGLNSDLINVMFTGSREQIEAGFRKAGWSLAQENNLRTRIKTIRAASELKGYASPMSSLLLGGGEAEMSWQKGLNDVSKRHHIRIWKLPEVWNGQQVWVGAASRDVSYAYLRPGRYFSHKIDPHVDEERDKVAYDLAFSQCADPAGWIDREEVPRASRNGTGDSVVTDARFAVVRLRECPVTQEKEPMRLATHGGGWNRFLRREILITRNDLLRANVYWRVAEGGYRMWRWMPDSWKGVSLWSRFRAGERMGERRENYFSSFLSALP